MLSITFAISGAGNLLPSWNVSHTICGLYADLMMCSVPHKKISEQLLSQVLPDPTWSAAYISLWQDMQYSVRYKKLVSRRTRILTQRWFHPQPTLSDLSKLALARIAACVHDPMALESNLLLLSICKRSCNPPEDCCRYNLLPFHRTFLPILMDSKESPKFTNNQPSLQSHN